MPRKLFRFLILFDNTSLLYFPGQFLSGRVLIQLQEDTTALGLHFHVVGEGVVRVRTARQERLYDRENYIDFRMRLLGEHCFCHIPHRNSEVEEARCVDKLRLHTKFLRSSVLQKLQQNCSYCLIHGTLLTGQNSTVLSPGIHSFPFKLGLPLGLPSTFLGKHGWVQYFCKTALREANGLTHKNQQVFIVMNPIDLNLESSVLSQAFRCEVEHKLGVSCIGSGPVLCRVSLDRGGYVPGESIGVSARIHNRSRVVIKSTRAALTETVTYMARGKVVQSERRELASLTRGKIKPDEVDEWHNEQLYVPPLPPTNLRGCHLIKIQYDVFFIIEPKSFEKEVKLQLPIIMATYPLKVDENDPISYKAGTHYPSTLPIFRPWLDEKPPVD